LSIITPVPGLFCFFPISVSGKDGIFVPLWVLISNFTVALLGWDLMHSSRCLCDEQQRTGVESFTSPPHGTRELLIYVACPAAAPWF
jgi:hypothetical protein